MTRDIICTWLKIPTDLWPPDHYTLLGLEPGASDPAQIEQHVHERHECLLRYQLTHPEEVTAAMNRLAQAFVCLSDPEAKKAYDAALLPPRPEAAPPAPSPTPLAEAAPVELTPVAAVPDPLAWLFGPWSQGSAETVVAAPVAPEAVSPEANGPATAPPIVPMPEAVADPVLELAAHSPSAWRGLGTKRALYYRISRTRQLLRAWMQLGKYIGDAVRPLVNRDDALELGRQLTVVRQLLQNFPPLLGQAGQPGYVVIVLARQQMIVQTFVTLLPGQREKLARDWLDGLELLAAHRRFLRDELWAMRRKGRLGRACRVVRSLLTDHPGLWLFLLALVAINLAFAVPPWLRGSEAVLIGLALASFVVYRTYFARRAWLDRTRRPVERGVRAGKAPKPTR